MVSRSPFRRPISTAYSGDPLSVGTRRSTRRQPRHSGAGGPSRWWPSFAPRRSRGMEFLCNFYFFPINPVSNFYGHSIHIPARSKRLRRSFPKPDRARRKLAAKPCGGTTVSRNHHETTYHLTPKGWVVSDDPPRDRVETWILHVERASGWPDEHRYSSLAWENLDLTDEEREGLRKQYGSCPGG